MPGAEPSVDAYSLWRAVHLATVLLANGDREQAAALLERGTAVIRDTPRMGPAGYGILDVSIHALRGEKQQALAALRKAEKAGWRGPWWRYYRDLDPTLASIRNEAGFRAVCADIERDVVRQRAELAKRPKDAPLDLGAAD